MGHISVLLCVYFIFTCTWILIESGDVTEPPVKTLNGKSLFDMGYRYNKPMLRLIGKSLMNLECQILPCSDWSEWSACKIFVGEYGIKSRTRQCGGTASGCLPQGEPRLESDSVVCQEFCPSNYVMIHDKFCLRIYNVSKQNKKDAESNCKADGGYLININSPGKFSAFLKLVQNITSIDTLHIDGQRKNNTSPWEYAYDTTGYTNWGPGDPDNGSSDLCMIAHKEKTAGWRLYDNSCSTARHFVCEIVPR